MAYHIRNVAIRKEEKSYMSMSMKIYKKSKHKKQRLIILNPIHCIITVFYLTTLAISIKL